MRAPRPRHRSGAGAGIAALLLASLSLLAAAATPPPEQDYVLQCRGCHGPDGRGLPGHVPSLHGLGRFLDVPEGRAYLVRVPGVAQASLDDARLAALLNWVLSRFGGAVASPPYDAAEVARLRATPLRDAAAARGALLRTMGDAAP